MGQHDEWLVAGAWLLVVFLLVAVFLFLLTPVFHGRMRRFVTYASLGDNESAKRVLARLDPVCRDTWLLRAVRALKKERSVLAANGLAKAVTLLVEAGASLGVRDRNGRTALHEIADLGPGDAYSAVLLENRVGVAQALIRGGASLSVEDNAGRAPARARYRGGDTRLIQFLRAQGGVPPLPLDIRKDRYAWVHRYTGETYDHVPPKTQWRFRCSNCGAVLALSGVDHSGRSGPEFVWQGRHCSVQSHYDRGCGEVFCPRCDVGKCPYCDGMLSEVRYLYF